MKHGGHRAFLLTEILLGICVAALLLLMFRGNETPDSLRASSRALRSRTFAL